MYRIEEISKIEQEHLGNWQKLWDSSMKSHFFNSPTWFKVYLETFNVEKYRVFFCYQDKQLVGVLPLVFTKKFGIKVLASIGGKYDFLDRSTLLLIKKDQKLVEAIFKKIKTKYNLYLAEVESCDARLFQGIDPRLSIEFSVNCPRMKVGEDILANVSKKQKKSLRKKIRKNGDKLEFKMFRTDLEKHLEAMLALEQKSHKKRKGISVFKKPHMIKLYQTLVARASNSIGISFLYFEGIPIAHRFGFFYHDTFMSVHIAFDDEFRTIGPGKLLLFYCLEYFKQNGIKTLDFSVGDSYIKRQFADEKISQHNIYFTGSKLVLLWWKILLKMKRKAKCIKKIIQECAAQGKTV